MYKKYLSTHLRARLPIHHWHTHMHIRPTVPQFTYVRTYMLTYLPVHLLAYVCTCVLRCLHAHVSGRPNVITYPFICVHAGLHIEVSTNICTYMIMEYLPGLPKLIEALLCCHAYVIPHLPNYLIIDSLTYPANRHYAPHMFINLSIYISTCLPACLRVTNLHGCLPSLKPTYPHTFVITHVIVYIRT